MYARWEVGVGELGFRIADREGEGVCVHVENDIDWRATRYGFEHLLHPCWILAALPRRCHRVREVERASRSVQPGEALPLHFLDGHTGA